jgi:hypothetical protein
MYCSKKGEARRLSTGQSKKPWISFWCRSIVMTCVRPDLHIIFASSLLTIQPRFLILPVQNTSCTHTQHLIPTRCTMYNTKFVNAQKAQVTYNFKSIKHKLLKTNGAIWFNKICTLIWNIIYRTQLPRKMYNIKQFSHVCSTLWSYDQLPTCVIWGSQSCSSEAYNMGCNATQTTSLNRKEDKTLETSYHSTSLSQLRHSRLQFWPGYVLITSIYSMKMLTMEFVGNQGCWDVAPCHWMCGSSHSNRKWCVHLRCAPKWPLKQAIHSFERLGGPLAQ